MNKGQCLLWEIATGLVGKYSILVFTGADLEFAKYFRTTGTVLQWPNTPQVEPFIERRRKRQKVRADIEYITWGAIVLNNRAYQVLHELLEPFGQFLPVACLGETLYFYNVTTLYSVVDFEKSEKTDKYVRRPAFSAEAIPAGFCIFKDALTANIAIYINDETKLALEKVLAEHKLTGLFFGEAGKLLT
jgi:hypothetical protein